MLSAVWRWLAICCTCSFAISLRESSWRTIDRMRSFGVRSRSRFTEKIAWRAGVGIVQRNHGIQIVVRHAATVAAGRKYFDPRLTAFGRPSGRTQNRPQRSTTCPRQPCCESCSVFTSTTPQFSATFPQECPQCKCSTIGCRLHLWQAQNRANDYP